VTTARHTPGRRIESDGPPSLSTGIKGCRNGQPPKKNLAHFSPDLSLPHASVVDGEASGLHLAGDGELTTSSPRRGYALLPFLSGGWEAAARARAQQVAGDMPLPFLFFSPPSEHDGHGGDIMRRCPLCLLPLSASTRAVGSPPSSGIEAVPFFAGDEHERGFLCPHPLNNNSSSRWG
jgi:hypothetical protein